MSRALGGHHEHIHRGRRDDLRIVDVEPVGKSDGHALLQVRFHGLLVNLRLQRIRNQHHHHVGFFARRFGRGDLQPAFLRDHPGLGIFQFADNDVDFGILEVQRVRMPLASITQDGKRLGFYIL